jgi:4-amino-4-deoxy-L-arabinose transferase-like glycosyltransferase
MSAEPGVAAEPEAQPVKKPPRKPVSARAPAEPRFTERLVAYGIDASGYSELGARWPLALLGLIAVMAAYLLGARLASPRAGLIGAVALLTSPYLVLESRQLTSDIAGITGSTLVALGLAGLALSSRWQALIGEERTERHKSLLAGALIAGDLAALAAGVLLVRESAGDLFGLVPPLAGFGIGVLVWGLIDRRRMPGLSPAVLVGAVALIAAAAALAGFLYQHFSWVEAGPGDRHLFGWTLDADAKRIAELGAPWKDAGDVQIPFSAAFEQIAFGLYPWVALAPVALVALVLGILRARDSGEADAESPAAFAGPVLFAWTAIALVLTTIAIRKITPVLFPAVGAIAVAIGVWMDSLLARRERDDDQAGSLPLLAFFVLSAALVIGKDISASPEEFTSLTAAGQAVKYPEGAKLHHSIFALGALFGLCGFAGLFLWRGPYRLIQGGRDLVATVGRFGLHAAVAVAVLLALYVSHSWIPGLSARMSSRDVLARYRELRRDGDLLGILGNLGSGPTYYAGSDYQKLNNRGDLIRFLGRKERVFALTRASEMCALQKEKFKKGFPFFVVDDENVQFRLLSNKLPDGEEDLNPLNDAVSRTPPKGVRSAPLAGWEDQIELVGAILPTKVERGARFEATFIYKIGKPVTRPWKVFVHIDAKAPPRIIGDHGFAGGHCPISTFQPGDYVIDRFEVKVPDSANRGEHRVWTGLFVGSAGNYTNMKVTTGTPDDNNRVDIGTIEVR